MERKGPKNMAIKDKREGKAEEDLQVLQPEDQMAGKRYPIRGDGGGDRRKEKQGLG